MYFILIGFGIGVLVAVFAISFEVYGYFRVDSNSDGDKDYYLLDVTKDLGKIPKKRFVIFVVDKEYRRK